MHVYLYVFHCFNTYLTLYLNLLNMLKDFSLLLIDIPFQNCLTPSHRPQVFSFAQCIPSGGVLKSYLIETWEVNSSGDLEKSCSPWPLEVGVFCNLLLGVLCLVTQYVCHLFATSNSSCFLCEASSLGALLPNFERFSLHKVTGTTGYLFLRIHLVSAA